MLDQNQTEEIEQVWPVIIAGGGIAGILCALKLALENPLLKILLLEKGPKLGGRLASEQKHHHDIAIGLSAISERLLDFINNTLSLAPDAKDLSTSLARKEARIGMVFGEQVKEIAKGRYYDIDSARAFNRAVKGEDWQNVQGSIFSDTLPEKDTVILKQLKLGQKDPATFILNQLNQLVGIASLEEQSFASFSERHKYFRDLTHLGPFNHLWQNLCELLKDQVTIKLNCQILAANWQETNWLIETEQGFYRSQVLTVAQSPWQATQWLDASLLPAAVLSQTFKTKPASTITLFETFKEKRAAIPDLLLIPSEGCYASCLSKESISYQCAIDFEVSMDASSVVKAIKKLKRARSKVQKIYTYEAENEAISLCPVAWSHGTTVLERKGFGQYDANEIQADHLVFCGDSYGLSANPEENLMQSLVAVWSKMSKTSNKEAF